MAINLIKNQKLNLLKDLKKAGIALGWDVNPTVSGAAFDLSTFI